MEWCIVGGWLMCGLIAGQMYKDRGYSMGWGLFVGFMLGPIGLLYAATRPKK